MVLLPDQGLPKLLANHPSYTNFSLRNTITRQCKGEEEIEKGRGRMGEKMERGMEGWWIGRHGVKRVETGLGVRREVGKPGERYNTSSTASLC